MDYGPVIFIELDFSRKNLGIELCDWLYYFIDWLILILIAQREKKIELSSCKLCI